MLQVLLIDSELSMSLKSIQVLNSLLSCIQVQLVQTAWVILDELKFQVHTDVIVHGHETYSWLSSAKR